MTKPTPAPVGFSWNVTKPDASVETVVAMSLEYSALDALIFRNVDGLVCRIIPASGYTDCAMKVS